MFTTRPLTLAMATLLATAPLATLAQGKDPVRVGLVTSKSGVFAQQGEEVLRAVQFAIDEANAAGGVDGAIPRLAWRESGRQCGARWHFDGGPTRARRGRRQRRHAASLRQRRPFG